MNRVRKIIFWAAITFIILRIVLAIVISTMNLEFASMSIESSYERFMFYTTQLALLLTLFGTIKSRDSWEKKTTVIIGTATIIFGICLFTIMSAFSGMCNTTNVKSLYESVDNSNTKIMIRNFGCGATDSGPPIVYVHKVEYFTDYFIRSTEIDTTKINLAEWIKVE